MDNLKKKIQQIEFEATYFFRKHSHVSEIWESFLTGTKHQKPPGFPHQHNSLRVKYFLRTYLNVWDLSHPSWRRNPTTSPTGKPGNTAFPKHPSNTSITGICCRRRQEQPLISPNQLCTPSKGTGKGLIPPGWWWKTWDQIHVPCPWGSAPWMEQWTTATSTSYKNLEATEAAIPSGCPKTKQVLFLLLWEGLNFPVLSPQLCLCRRSCHGPVAPRPQEGSYQNPANQTSAPLCSRLPWHSLPVEWASPLGTNSSSDSCTGAEMAAFNK